MNSASYDEPLMVVNYASLGRRFLAAILDGMVLFVPALIASHLIPVVGGILLALLYFPVMEASELRATVGKHWMGIQVADVSGGRISLRAAMIRYFVKIASMLLLCVGCLLAFFTERRQTLHDLIAETVVVYGRREAPVFEVWLASVRSLFTRTSRTVTQAMGASNVFELERLQALREKGALTEEEFQAEKRKILGRRTD